MAGLLCIALLLFYGASPYFCFWRFTAALQAGDAAAITGRVDFPAVRESLKKQLAARFFSAAIGDKRFEHNRLGRLAAEVGPALINTLVDAYVTPDGLAALIADPNAVKERRPPQQPRFGKGFDWSKVKYAFFTSPRVFVVNWEGTKLRFRFEGLHWRLNKVDLGLIEPKS